MAKHHFVIEHRDEKHKCYLDEAGRVYVLNSDGSTRAVSAPTGIQKVDDAKVAAKTIISSFEKKKK
jgi:hypothetical protein